MALVVCLTFSHGPFLQYGKVHFRSSPELMHREEKQLFLPSVSISSEIVLVIKLTTEWKSVLVDVSFRRSLVQILMYFDEQILAVVT